MSISYELSMLPLISLILCNVERDRITKKKNVPFRNVRNNVFTLIDTEVAKLSHFS